MWLIVLLGIAASQTPEPAADSELRDALRGRIAGAPVACLKPRLIRRTRVIDGTAIIYEVSSSRWYLQRPQLNGAVLDPRDTLVSRAPIASLCRSDVVDIVDNATGVRTGFATLEPFVPFDRVKK